MPSLSSNISGTLDLCGVSGATTEHPNLIGRTGRIINQIARMMMREARLSDQNQYLRFLTLSSPSKEVSIPSISDPASICTVELLSDVTNDVRADVDIVGRLELNEKESIGAYACARFANPTRLRFSWNPAGSSQTIYVGYEVLPVNADQMTGIPSLPESFHDCLQYRSAALVKETILEKAMGEVFQETMEMMENQWLRWCKRSAEERPTVKPGFGSLDAGDSMEGWT